MTWLLVAAGGAVGSMARHGVNVAIHRWVGTPVPYATAVVDILGCAVIGVLAGASQRAAHVVLGLGAVFLGYWVAR